MEDRWGWGELDVRRPIRDRYSSSLKRSRAGAVGGMVAVGFESMNRSQEYSGGAAVKTWLIGCES